MSVGEKLYQWGHLFYYMYVLLTYASQGDSGQLTIKGDDFAKNSRLCQFPKKVVSFSELVVPAKKTFLEDCCLPYL